MGLKEGDIAPAIAGVDQDGKAITLEEYKGKKVILYFYPKDDTPGCTAESCNLRDNYSGLAKEGFEVIGVSVDTERKHRNFIEKYNLPFRLIADTDHKVVNDYGVWQEKSMFGKKYMGIVRTTFVIDEEGKIEKIFDNVDTENHTEQIREALEV